MYQESVIVIVLLIANVLVSLNGFRNLDFFNGYKFTTYDILRHKDYKRLLTSGFLHVNPNHLIFNMLSFFIFGSMLEPFLGSFQFSLLYVLSLLGGNLLSLFIHRNKDTYSAVGASGAVSGVIYAYIVLFPTSGMGLLFLPGISIPAWIFGLLYLGYTLYGIKSQKDNIGHEAHLGGAITGVLTLMVFMPNILTTRTETLLLILGPALLFLYAVWKQPHLLLLSGAPRSSTRKKETVVRNIDDLFNANKIRRQQELDHILDKINQKGIDSLTREERRILDEHSKS